TACAAARVTTIRLPASATWSVSPTLAAHLLQYIARPRVPKQLCNLMPQFPGLFWRRLTLLPNALLAVRRANNGVHNQLVALNPRPSTKRNLATALERSEQCAFRNNRLPCFKIIKRRDRLRHLLILQSRLHANRTLTHCRHQDVRRNDFSNPPA